MFIPGSRVLIFQYSYRNSYTNNQYLAAQRPLANTSDTSRGPYNHRAATSSCDSACKHCILGSHNSPTTGMLLTGETTSSQHGRTRCTQKKSWNCKEDTSADSPGYLLPCTYCRNWSEGSDMSQCDAVHEDSPCCRRPHFLKQTAALRTHTHTQSISWCSGKHRTVLCPMKRSAVMAMLHVYAVQFGYSYSHVATERLKCG